MIAAWMLYSVTLGALLICAALPVERFVNAIGAPTRRVWLIALVGALVMPVSGIVLRDAPPAVEFGVEVVATSASAGAVMKGVETLAPLDSALGLLWALGSALLLVAFVGGLVVTAYRRRRWSPESVDGFSVLVSDEVGPAVVGFLRPRIVLPVWALEADAAEREMMLRHEQEHLRAGDPHLMLLGALALIGMPWNAPLWFIVHRIRLAIEVDCDRRVVRSGGLDLRRYAELLLSVGARRSVPIYAVGFSVGRPFLEQRIERMTIPAPERRRLRALLLFVGVIGVLGAAWSVPQPVRATWIDDVAFPVCAEDRMEVTRHLLTISEWSS